MKKRHILTIFILCLTPFAIASADQRFEKYSGPDIKDDFCGKEMPPHFCRCAFHGDCDAAGMDKGEANDYVRGEFATWSGGQFDAFGANCVENNGILEKEGKQCRYCEGDHVREGDKCIKADKATKVPDGPFNSDCSIKESEFARDWGKYSDFDDRISDGASYEVQQWNQRLDEIADLIAEAQGIEYEMEIDRQVRLELRDYKARLVDNLRDNIVKSIIRLTWVTRNAVKGAQGWGGSYATMFTGDKALERIGAGMKFVQSGIQAGSKLEFDTKTVTGKVKSTAWNATLETLESYGDPKAVAIQAIKDVTGGAFAEGGVSGPDITPEEVEILRVQHLENKLLDQVLAESYAENAKRRIALKQIEANIKEKYNEMEEWKDKERGRVKDALVKECKEFTK